MRKAEGYRLKGGINGEMDKGKRAKKVLTIYSFIPLSFYPFLSPTA
jgi:hypothetical protein